jgi:hypothetical protein
MLIKEHLLGGVFLNYIYIYIHTHARLYDPNYHGSRNVKNDKFVLLDGVKKGSFGVTINYIII